jgi:hypothetical protein
MHWAQLGLTAGLILGPPLLYGALVAVCARIQVKRARAGAGRLTVADLVARVQRDREKRPDHEDRPRLPFGWQWPTRDHDDDA